MVIGAISGVGGASVTANVGIGTTTPSARLEVAGQVKITGGAPGAGKVLTSNAVGLATWQTPAAAGSTLDAAYDFGGAGAGRTITANDGAVKIQGEDGLLVTGTLGSGADIEVSGVGTRMFFNPKKAAFRAGYVVGTDWDNANVGIYSVAIGRNTLASGSTSLAIGSGAVASGDVSVAIGENVSAGGNGSIAMGTEAIASGFYSTAMGTSTMASAYFSTALGLNTRARSFVETAIGGYNTTYTPASTTGWNAADRLFVVGNGTADNARSDAFTILKSGEMKLGSKGTYFTNVQEGTVGAGSSAAVSKEVLIVFPTEFINAANVRINVQAVNESPVTDQFLVTVKQINTAGAMVIVRRMDGPTSWGQNLQIHWMAWE